jgi:hypothetical protein
MHETTELGTWLESFYTLTLGAVSLACAVLAACLVTIRQQYRDIDRWRERSCERSTPNNIEVYN